MFKCYTVFNSLFSVLVNAAVNYWIVTIVYMNPESPKNNCLQYTGFSLTIDSTARLVSKEV